MSIRGGFSEAAAVGAEVKEVNKQEKEESASKAVEDALPEGTQYVLRERMRCLHDD